MVTVPVEVPAGFANGHKPAVVGRVKVMTERAGPVV